MVAAGFYKNADGTGAADIELKVYGDETFQLTTEFYYLDRAGVSWKVEPNTGNETTDLASVPPWLWGLIASYGRQLAPALMHDYYCDIAKRDKANNAPSAYADRRATDLRFREALRIKTVPWFRSNVFWAGVTFDRYKTFRLPLAITFIAQALAAAVGVLAAVGVWLWHLIRTPRMSSTPRIHHHPGLLEHPWAWLLLAACALLLSIAYGWNSMLAVGTGCLAAPVVLLVLTVNLVMSVILALPDAVTWGVANAVTFGRARVYPPIFKPFRIRF